MDVHTAEQEGHATGNKAREWASSVGRRRPPDALYPTVPGIKVGHLLAAWHNRVLATVWRSKEPGILLRAIVWLVQYVGRDEDFHQGSPTPLSLRRSASQYGPHRRTLQRKCRCYREKSSRPFWKRSPMRNWRLLAKRTDSPDHSRSRFGLAAEKVSRASGQQELEGELDVVHGSDGNQADGADRVEDQGCGGFPDWFGREGR